MRRRRDESRPFPTRNVRSLRVTVVSLVVGVGLVGGFALPANAAAVTPEEQRMAAKMTKRISSKALGKNTAGIVIDAPSGRVLWSRRPSAALRPASVTKLATALTAMDVLGPGYRATTRVVHGAPHSVYLVGGGDALLTSRDLRRMARTTALALRSRGITVAHVRVDDSLYPAPSRSVGWKRSYTPGDVSPVRALVVNGRQRRDTSLNAGRTFGRQLERYGVTIKSVRRKQQPAGKPTLASHASPEMRVWLSRMLLISDNDIAEQVLRQAAVAKGMRPTWTNARAVRNAVLSSHKISGLRLYDGSGLSRSGRMTAAGTARLLSVVYADSVRNDLIDMLPLAGRTGTLQAAYHRFTSRPATCARDRVRAKTGTLDDAAALAGIAVTASGRQRIFVILENGKPSSSRVRRAIDNLAATATGCA